MKKFLALSALFLVSVPAFGYIPPAGFLVKTVAAKHGVGKSVRFRGLVQRYEGEIPSGVQFKASVLLEEETGRVRFTAYDESGKALYIAERDLTGGLAPLSIPANAIAQILMDSNATRITQALKKEGIDATESEESAPVDRFLARWNRSFAWVIGKKNVREGKIQPQLWIEKDTFYPVRLIPSAPAPELQFENFRYFHEFPFPRGISQIQDKHILIRVEFQDLTKNSPSDPAVFKTPADAGFTKEGNAAPESLKRLIRQFFEGISG